MAERVLEVREEIGALLITEADLEGEVLIPSDWTDLGEMVHFLRPFRELTKGTESTFDAVDRVLPAMEYMLKHLEEWRERWVGNEAMEGRVQRAWDKMDRYYTRTDDTLIYITATVMNPGLKFGIFKQLWAGNNHLLRHLRAGESRLRNFWTTNYAPKTADASSPTATSPVLPLPLRSVSGFDNFLASTATRGAVRSSRDELDTYLDEPCLH